MPDVRANAIRLRKAGGYPTADIAVEMLRNFLQIAHKLLGLDSIIIWVSRQRR
jgi:hypothetical protein